MKKKMNQLSRFYISKLKQFGGILAYRDGGWYCHYCHIPLVRKVLVVSPDYAQATIDHKEALAKGGADATPNMVLACEKCNWEKADRDYTEFYIATADRRTTPRPEFQWSHPFAEE